MSAPVDVLAELRQIANGEGDTELLAMRCYVAIAEQIKAHAALLAQVDAGTSADYRALQEHRVVHRSRAALRAVGGAK